MASRIPRLQLSRLPRIDSQQVLLLSSGRGTRQRLGAALLAAVAALALLALALALRPEPRYVLVIDAGSSGTRMYAYTWRDGAGAGGAPALAVVPATAAPTKVPRRVLPGKRAYQRVETEPGLDQFVGDAKGLKERALGPLLEWAEAVVPQRQWARTPVFLCGTAGLRKLSEQQQGQVLEGVRAVLGGASFRFHPPWARIISGTDEGVYGWIALNYLEGRLQAAAAAADKEGGGGGTLGALDLGGSSMEVTFAAGSVPWEEDAVNVTLLGAPHSLYSHVHHHYGLNDAFDRSVSILLSRLAPPVTSGNGSHSPDGIRQDQQQQQQQQEEQKREQQEQQKQQQEEQQRKVGSRPSTEGGGGSDGQPSGQQQVQEGGDDGPAGRRLQAPAVLLRRLRLAADASGGGSKEGHAAGQQLHGQQRGRQLDEVQEVEHPCVHKGYRQAYRRLPGDGADTPDPPEVLLVGRPDYAACQELAHAVVNASVPCSAPPCALGTPQPSSAGHHFVALTGFYVVYRFYRLPPHAGMAALEEAGRQFCGLSWGEVQAGFAGELMVEDYCFRAPYISALVSQGLLLQDEQLRIGGSDVGWTLGAALAEGYRLGGLGKGSSKRAVFSRSSVAPVLLLLAGASAVTALLCLARAQWGQQWPCGGPHGLGWPSWRSGWLGKVRSKGSSEMISLGIDSSPFASDRSSRGGSSAGLSGLVYPGALSSRGASPLQSARSAGWGTARSNGGQQQHFAAAEMSHRSSSSSAILAAAAAAEPSSLAGSPSWAALMGSPGPTEAFGGSDAASALPRETSYSSNLNRLGRSRSVSRRSLAISTTSPEGGD